MNSAKQATPHKEVIERLLNSNFPKSELEWAARREIMRLKEKNQSDQARIKDLQEDIRTHIRQNIKLEEALDANYQARQCGCEIATIDECDNCVNATILYNKAIRLEESVATTALKGE